MDRIKHFSALFLFAHLPSHLAEVSKPFGEHAERLIASVSDQDPPGVLIEMEEALRDLLKSKDSAVRAELFRPKRPPVRIPENGWNHPALWPEQGTVLKIFPTYKVVRSLEQKNLGSPCSVRHES